jgi:hypothetical protein
MMAEADINMVPASRTKHFFQVHAKVLSFVGALIVFSTFVVKEGIREHLKNLSDSISSAESIFLVRTDINELPIYLAYLNSRIGTMENLLTSATKTTAAPSLATMRETVDLMLANAQRAVTSRDNLSHTIDVLGKNEAIMSGLGQISNEVAVLASRSDVVNRAAVAMNQSPAPNPDGIQHIIGKANEVTNECTALRLERIAPLQKQTIQVAEERRTHYEKFYEQSTWLSYLLYAVGWGLGLAGRMFSVEGLVGGV